MTASNTSSAAASSDPSLPSERISPGAASPSNQAAPIAPRPPYLLWPVSRKEFYGTIWIALMPALAWGMILFGIRVIFMVTSAMVAVTFVHLLINRWLPWQRGKSLLYSHCLVSAMVLVALANPMWPVWTVAVMALLIPLMLAIVGGPGREHIHIAAVLALALQFAVMPLLPSLKTYAGGPDAILARDRLFMGDIRDQRRGPLDHWATSRDLAGNDAARIRPPSQVAGETLDAISRELVANHDAADTSGVAPALRQHIDDILNRAFAFDLPGMDLQILGAVPGRVGTVSLFAMTLAGLYLSYRYILRPRSVVLFLTSFIVGTVLFALRPSAIAHAGLSEVWALLRAYRGEMGTLLNFLLLSSDAGFATVVILALPGTEPLTARGRRIFLILAGILGAWLHRIEPGVPAATLVLCALMPTAPLFDRLFAKRSWLNARP